MRRLLPILVVLTLLLSAVPPAVLAAHASAAVPPGPTSAACGDQAPDGLILYRAYDRSGQPADPPLALTDPTNTIHLPVAVPDPQVIIPIPFGCRAIVRSGSGVTYLVDGVTGEARELPLGDPAVGWTYDAFAGGRRWGLFMPVGSSLWRREVVVDFATGQVIDLFALIPGMRTIGLAWFSPSGAYLTVRAEMAEGEDPTRQWLVPMEHPDQARPIGDLSSFIHSFDETERRMLYTIGGTDRRELVIEDLADGTTRAVAAPPTAGGRRSSLRGWFLAGTNDLAIMYGGRFVLLDLSGETPTERFALDGAFIAFQAAPSGTGGILMKRASSDNRVAPYLTYVDFDQQTAWPITSEFGEPVRSTEMWRLTQANPRWVLLALGTSEDAPTGLASFDSETGQLTDLHPLTDERLNEYTIQGTADGRVLLVPSDVGNGGQRLRVLDLEHGMAVVLTHADAVTGALSPDGS